MSDGLWSRGRGRIVRQGRVSLRRLGCSRHLLMLIVLRRLDGHCWWKLRFSQCGPRTSGLAIMICRVGKGYVLELLYYRAHHRLVCSWRWRRIKDPHLVLAEYRTNGVNE